MYTPVKQHKLSNQSLHIKAPSSYTTPNNQIILRPSSITQHFFYFSKINKITMTTYTNKSTNSKGHIQLLIIGSSIIRDVQASRIEQNSPALTICMPGAKIEQLSREIFNIKRNQFIHNMIIHGGGNDINARTIRNPHVISNRIITTLQDLSTRMPRTQIFYSAILPRTNDTILPAIFLINRDIKQYCIEQGIVFIPNYQFTYQRVYRGWLKYEIRRTMIKDDLVHPTPAGTRTLARNFIDTYRATQPTFRIPQQYRHHPSRTAHYQNPAANNQFRHNPQHHSTGYMTTQRNQQNIQPIYSTNHRTGRDRTAHHERMYHRTTHNHNSSR